MQKAQSERLGVAGVDYFFSQHGWLFREQTTHDYGIDAHVEIVDNERPTGKLITLQIKSGTSYFSEENKDAFIFRTNDAHVAYWVSHSMPGVLILYNPETKQAFWPHVNRETVESTGKNWKLGVPKANMFEEPEETLKSLCGLAQPEPYLRRLNRLRVDRRWMDLIEAGDEVRVKFDAWVDKSLPRYQLIISTSRQEENWPILYSPNVGVEEMLEHLFPWADFAVDHDAHEEGARFKWAAECYAGHDSETGLMHYCQTFGEWYTAPKGLVPISEDGETESYTLILSLNDFGRNFITIDGYLGDPAAIEKLDLR